MQKRVKIKMCGMTRPEDAQRAAQLGADAIGMILSAVGPRQIESEQAKKIVSSLPENVKKVGVFVDEPLNRVNELITALKLDFVQLHGKETPEYCGNILCDLIKAIKVVDAESLNGLNAYPVEAFLFDGKRGGSGQPFDWALLSQVQTGKIRILAGGLNSDNVGEAIQQVRPDWVDVSSGIESDQKGIKDPQKMQRFVEAVESVK